MKKLLFLSLTASFATVAAQENHLSVAEKTNDSLPKTITLDEVLVSAVRAKSTLPVTFSNISKQELQKRNLGQDIPVLMGYLPNVTFSTNAGSNVGSSMLNVRGSDSYRTNITINGIPYNDSESHITVWENISDFASSVESLQLQRGVGTSTNGSAAFGASLNLLTDAVSENAYAEISNTFGSYNTQKHSVKASTGKLNDRFEVSARLSKITSDGYIERASSDLKSYFLQGAYSHKNTLIKALIFGNVEHTYITWNGIGKATMDKNRRFNWSGYIGDDANGNPLFYENEKDNYWQDHSQLHWSQQWTPNWTTNLAFHYTKGKGFYENYENGRFTKYGLPELTPGGRTDVIVEKWLANDFYGTTFSANYISNKIDFIFGGAANQYDGRHFRQVLWAKEPVPFGYKHIYTDEDTVKKEASAFAKITYQLSDKWQFFADLQYRHIYYQSPAYEVDTNFNFINPKAGITYTANAANAFYLSYGKASREPNRADFKDNYPLKPKAEHLNDFEFGWRFASPKTKINANLYYMAYKDQLVLTGELNDTNYPIRTNSGDSYRAGIEVDAVVLLSDKWTWRPNVSVSRNKNRDFILSEENTAGQTIFRNLGNTNISYSPNVVAGNIITFEPIPNLQLSLLSKFVGSQYITNTDDDAAKLDSYFVNDLSANYTIYPKKILKSVQFSVIGNNVLNQKYVAYAAWWGEAYYFPQAETNVLAGVTLRF
ncbi:MAG: TonB-dependent receptor [Capnocytophaga sp.]|nr:TonB-dependent receptor [Capnocytophaga sp.]